MYIRRSSLQQFISRWLDTGSVNFLPWVTLVEAELASLDDGPDAFRLYDEAVKLAYVLQFRMAAGSVVLIYSFFLSHLVKTVVGFLMRETLYSFVVAIF